MPDSDRIPRDSEAEHHLAGTAFRLAGLLRGELDPERAIHAVSAALLKNAVFATSPLTGFNVSTLSAAWPLPDSDLPVTGEPAWEKTLSAEADWLSRHPHFWAAYGNELMRLSGSRHLAAEHSSSLGLQSIILEICKASAVQDRTNPSILDAACGRGTLLSAMASLFNDSSPTLAGQDIAAHELTFAAWNLGISGREVDLKQGDLFSRDCFPDSRFDVVVLDGPLGLQREVRREAESDARWPAGLPVPRRAEWEMLLMALAKVKRADEGGGILVALMPSALLSRFSADDPVRQWLNRQDLIQAVVALPFGAGSVATGIETSVLAISTSKPQGFTRKSQVIDLRGSFIDYGPRSSLRRVSEDGLRELNAAIARAKPSPLVRTCTTQDFEYRTWTYVISGVSAIVDGRTEEPVKLHLPQLDSVTQPAWPPTEIPEDFRIEATKGEHVETVFDVDRVFSTRSPEAAQRSLAKAGWSTAPLLLHVRRLVFRRPGKRSSQLLADSWPEDRSVLLIPLDSKTIAEVTSWGSVNADWHGLAVETSEPRCGDFLASWLQSTQGQNTLRLVRESVSGSRISPLANLRPLDFLSQLYVPIPEAQKQEQILEAHHLIEAETARLRQMGSELWSAPNRSVEVALLARRYATRSDLAAWSESLPYPLAISLRTVHAFQDDDEKASRQLVHFWEATAAFLANYLISAFVSASDLWAEEVPQLRSALKEGNASFERATLGTWKITVERLSRTLRDLRRSDDPDQRDRISRILGRPPEHLIERILDPELSRLLGELSFLRNKVDGHGGTMTPAIARQVRNQFNARTEDLRDILGYGWSDFPLVRQKSIDLDDSGYSVTAEVLVGPTVPFVTRNFATPEPLRKTQLYLLGDDGLVRLAPFVQLGRATEDPEATCWFYNRRETTGVRLVTYQAARENDITRNDDALETILRDIATLERPDGIPDLSQL